jgi:hypothetical protein
VRPPWHRDLGPARGLVGNAGSLAPKPTGVASRRANAPNTNVG